MRMGERFERCGIAIAGCLESAGTTHLEGSIGNLCTAEIRQKMERVLEEFV